MNLKQVFLNRWSRVLPGREGFSLVEILMVLMILTVGIIPLAIGGFLMLVNPEYIQTFFNTQAGTIMLGVAIGMELLGFILIRKIVQIKY